ncbi:MAG: hypothetical protein NT062_33430 [Proteobacteria bacterium]|nr:hypothetical protein [Pseudomonadota bacterium]
MKPSPRASWNALSPVWQGFLREVEAFASAEPTDAELAQAFAATSFTVGDHQGQAVDLNPLASFHALTELRVYGGSSLASLPRLPRLTSLSVEHAELPDDLGARVPRLAQLTLVPVAAHARALRGLRVAAVDVEHGRGIDLAVLAHLPALRRLRMDDGPARQVPALAALTTLEELDLRYTKVRDLAPLAKLRRLRVLDLSCTAVADLAPLAKLTQLETLSIFGCARVADLAPLRHLAHLTRLDVTSTQVADLTPLAGLARLRALDVSHTRVTDLAPLAGATRLTDLTAIGTPIRDLSPLATHAALTSVDVRESEVIDVRPLHDLRALVRVDVEQTRVPYAEAEALLAVLRKRHRAAQVAAPRRPLAHFPGPLDATFYAVVAALFDADKILRGASAIYIAEACIARPGDWPYAIERMTFQPRTRTWTLWLDVYGAKDKLVLVAPRDVRVGPQEFTVGGADRITYRGKRCKVREATAFRMGW